MGTKQASLTDHLRSAVELGKRKVESKRLGKERRREEQGRAQAIAALGTHAWEQRIRRESYAALFDRLAALEEQQAEGQKQLDGIRAAVGQRQAERQEIEERFGASIADLETALGQLTSQLNEAVSHRKSADKAHRSLRSRQKSVRRALQADRSRLQKAEAAPAEPDPVRTETLRRKIAERQQQLAEIDQEIPRATQDVTRRTAEEAERRSAAEEGKQHLSAERERCAQTLRPVAEAMEELEDQAARLEKQSAALDQQKTQGLAELGAQVNAARPPVEGLSEDYRQIDAQAAEVARIDGQIVALEQKIATAGPGAKRLLYGVAALGIVAVLFALGVAFQFFYQGGGGRSSGELSVHVADRANAAVLGANTLLFFEGGPVAQYSDVHGAATLTLDEARGRRGRLVVEAPGFKIHEQEVRLTSGQLVEVRLEPPDPEMAKVLVRVVDSSSREPVAGAQVLVLANGDTFSQDSDSNGITKFTLAFYDSKAEAEMSVRSKGHEIEHQRVTLLPDRVQDVSLDPAADTLEVTAFDVEGALRRNFREAEGSMLRPGTRATGQLRAGTVVGYTFTGHANTPILFTTQRTDGELSYRMLLYDPKDFLIGDHGRFHGNTYRIPFTPPADGEYQLHLKGDARGGSFAVSMAYLSGPPEKRNQIAPLTLEASEKGMLAVGAFDDFTFPGSANTPLLLKFQRASGELGYSVELFDDRDTSLVKRGKYWDGLRNFPFTPPADGIYRARIQGTDNFGSYTLAMQLVASGKRNQLVELGFDQSRQGELALGAADEYRFEGHRNTPVLFTLQRTSGELGYWLEIYDQQDRRISQHGRLWGSTYNIPFTPQADGPLRLRIAADREFGSYVLSVRLVSGPPSERNRLLPLVAGGSQSGDLAAGAFDDYSFAGKAGERLVFTTQHLAGSLGYWVHVFDSEGEELAKHGRFHQGTQQIEFEPPTDTTYRIRISADREFGPYVITLNER